jgi:hypothetical protein
VGTLDQFAKDTFAEETPILTHDAMAWEPPKELGLSEVRLDGLLIVRASEPLLTLPAPWSEAAGHDDIVLEIKMPGDHLDDEAVERALLRRQAWQVKRVTSKPPRSGQTPVWIVAPNRPELLGQAGRIQATKTAAPGCYRLGPAWFDGLWIAANELPLDEALIPFLIARSGTALDRFGRWVVGRWVVGRRSPDWLLRMLQFLPMSQSIRDELWGMLPPAPEPEILERQNDFWYNWAKRHPEATKPFVQQGLQQGLQPLAHVYERRLGRPLSKEEHRALAERLERLGADRLGDVVLDLSPGALTAWLADPHAT